MPRCIDTKCIHLEEENSTRTKSHFGSISFPIYQTATFAHPAVGKSTGFDYSRLQNPTREHLEKIVATLEHGTSAFALSSGMAAISLLFELFGSGDRIVADSDLYGGSVRLFEQVSTKNGLQVTLVDFSREDVERFITEQTKAIYLETSTNPMMHVHDIDKYARIAKRHWILLIVDNTFLSPYFQNPLELGADIVVHSGTKYLGGHNDTLAGFLVTNRKDVEERLRFLAKTTGAGLAPFDSWLILRGLKTLGIRMERSQENAIRVAKFLLRQKEVFQVIYPGLESHPGFSILQKQARGFGGMITFQVQSEQMALSILRNVQLVQFAESLGGVETLITYPITQTHADVPKEILQQNGITEKTLRLSVGIENIEDLLQDLHNAFRQARKESK